MRKRSEAKPKPKSSAAERTVSMQYTDKTASVTCGLCDVVSTVGKCPSREDGTLECPACGAPIEGAATAAPKKSEEDIPFPETKVIGPETKVIIGSVPPVPAISTPAISSVPPVVVKAQAHEAPPRAYCSKCGSEWPIVNGQPFPNCGHKDTTSIADPNKAERFNPPAGSARATVLGRTLRVTRGKHNFPYPGMSYGGFSIGPFEVSAELSPDVNLVEASRQIRADLKKMADEAFAEEMEWYGEKLDQLAKSSGG